MRNGLADSVMLTGVLRSLALMVLVSFAAFQVARWESADASRAGDVNCDGIVSSIDAALVLQSNAGLISSLPCEDKADVDGSGGVNPLDALLILQFGAGLLDALGPEATPSSTATPTGVLHYEGTFTGGTISLAVSADRTLVHRFSADQTSSCLQDVTFSHVPITAGEFYFERPSSLLGAGFEVTGTLGPRVEPPLAVAEAAGTVSFFGCELFDIVWTASLE